MKGASQKMVKTTSRYSAWPDNISSFFLVNITNTTARTWFGLTPQYNKRFNVDRFYTQLHYLPLCAKLPSYTKRSAATAMPQGQLPGGT